MGHTPMLIGVAETADLLGVKPLTVLRWIYAHRLPATKVGKKWLIRSDDIGRILDEQSTFRIARGPALNHSFLQPLLEPELTERAEMILAILRLGRWPSDSLPIDVNGVKLVLRDEETPTPIFWRHLCEGIAELWKPQRKETPKELNDAVDAWQRGDAPNPFDVEIESAMPQGANKRRSKK